ncbi:MULTISPECIES: thioesterase II family protein [Pseudomonadota]|uniref:thioesterase II family protein n=1 Tax=Pseudomonadota TaxID=1224 RepID=UPI0008CF66DB|nr:MULTISPECIES: alpha/beta fold hydrolase [Pseudomonadota]MDO9418526.1 thioesterase domain-containing protein [Pararhizobium sp.]SEU11030.1 Surfactin synthase thioesterase subunit [Pseudomonas sp. NFR09]
MSAADCIRSLARGGDERVRLVCFPHAGAGASIYHAWSNHLPSWVGIYGVQLPGREQRINQAPVTAWQPLVDEIIAVLAGWDDTPFIFYGHSLGGLLAYEVASGLQRAGLPGPRILFAGGAYAPSAVCKEKTRFNDEAGLMDAVRRLGGVNDAVMQDQDFIQHFMPVIAADFTLFNRYTPAVVQVPLDCPVVALFGSFDEDHDREGAMRWREHTRGRLYVHEVAGGHFFHRESAAQTLDVVKRFATAGGW